MGEYINAISFLRHLNLLFVVVVQCRGSLRHGLPGSYLLFAFPFVLNDILIIIVIASFVVNEIHIAIRIFFSTTATVLAIVYWSIKYLSKWVVS